VSRALQLAVCYYTVRQTLKMMNRNQNDMKTLQA
jgi:hypothetical protein